MLQQICSKVNTTVVINIISILGDKMYTERLLLAREKRGLTQKELSKMIGIKQQQYARYEKGINIMPVTHLKKICIALDISADYILGLTDEIRTYKKKS